MEGPSKKQLQQMREDNMEDDMSGMIPRAVGQVFASAQSLKEQGWEVCDNSISRGECRSGYGSTLDPH